MATVDLIMPKLGESIMEATILKWHKQPGDTVKMDETVLEIATDKVDSEVPSTAEGVIEEILFKVNDVVPIGTVIARIKTGAEETVTSRPVISTTGKGTRAQAYKEQKLLWWNPFNQTCNFKPCNFQWFIQSFLFSTWY